MDRRYEIESLRRSIAMLSPGVQAPSSREGALALLAEQQDVQQRLRVLREALRSLVDEH